MIQQAWTFISKKEVGLTLGLTLTAFSVGLIIYGNFFVSSESPQRFVWEHQPALYICDTAPDWALPGHPQFEQAIKFWDDLGWSFASIEVGPCPTICSAYKDGMVQHRSCNRGKVTLDLMPQWFDEEHAGKCSFEERVVFSGLAAPNDWTTIMVPNRVPDVLSSAFGEAPPMLPTDPEAKVLAHEIGHCLVGLDHNLGPSLGCSGGCRLNSKAGHVMNPSTFHLGWGDEALPTAPSNWK